MAVIPGIASDAAIAEEHGRVPAEPKAPANTTAVEPLTTADVAPKKAKAKAPAKKAAPKKRK